ncbi:MAG: hypothetical protein ACKOB3_04325, partial [Holophagaceae bacterium]
MFRTPPSDIRQVCGYRTTTRRFIGGTRASRPGSQSLVNLCPEPPISGQIELDSHADTCVLGANFVILSYTGRVCDVAPYSPEYDSIKNIPIVSGATAWTLPSTGETFILIINEAIWMGGSLSHSLINPNQLRSFGTTVQDNPFATHLTITDPEDRITVPMTMDGTNVVATTRTPTQQEIDNCPHIHLTSDHEWNPGTFRTPVFDEDHVVSSVDVQAPSASNLR